MVYISLFKDFSCLIILYISLANLSRIRRFINFKEYVVTNTSFNGKLTRHPELITNWLEVAIALITLHPTVVRAASSMVDI